MVKATKPATVKKEKKVANKTTKVKADESKSEIDQAAAAVEGPEQVKTPEAADVTAASAAKEPEASAEIEHTITQVDLENNPELLEAGIKVGEDVIIEKHEVDTFVIPYLKSAAAGDELKYALRSIAYSFPQDKVIIIGDKEDWFNENIIHIPHTPESDNPQIDVVHKLLLGITSGSIDGDFILTYDDVFLLGQTSIEDISILKAFGVLDHSTGKQGGVYNKNALNTLKALKEEANHDEARKGRNFPIHKYDTHTPVILNAEVLTIIIDRFNADTVGHLIKSLYFNEIDWFHRPVQVTGGLHDPILVSVYRKDPSVEILEDAIAKRKFMNVNDAGWQAVKPYLKKLYPEKSIFEK